MSSIDSFLRRTEAYENTAEHNDSLHTEFTRLTQSIGFLDQHRKYIEANELGFGDAAFHYMWYLLLKHITENFSEIKCLEIGVYKGQVISLWALIASQLERVISITGVSPFEGKPLPESRWTRRLKMLVSSRFREDLKAANFYPEEDYQTIVKNLFETFDLARSKVQLIKGFSSDAEVVEISARERYTLIYIDGDHSFKGATADIKNYAPLIEPNGFLVMDDASYYLPGGAFWKGHETVSRACEIIPSLGFTNVLNIGHNRIYKKIK